MIAKNNLACFLVVKLLIHYFFMIIKAIAVENSIFRIS